MGINICTRDRVINIRTIIVILIFIPFIKPAYFNQVMSVDYMYNFATLLSTMTVCILFLKSPRIRLHTAIFLIYQVLYLITSYLNGISISQVFIPIVMNVLICLLLDNLVHNSTKSLINGLTWLLSALVAINFTLLFLYPDGIVTNSWGAPIHFLQGDNKLTPILIITMVFSILNSLYKYNKISIQSYIIIFLCGFTVIKIWSATGVVAIVVFLLHMIFMNNEAIKKRLNIRKYTIIFVSLFIVFVILGMQKYFSFVIEELLKKDITFNNRVFIWENAINIIKNSGNLQILIGHGYEVRLFSVNMMGTFYQTHAHNQILEIVIQSGFIGLVLMGILIVNTARKLLKYQNNKMAYVLTGALFSFFIMGLSELCFYTPFYMVLIISNNIDIIISQYEKYQYK